METQKMIYAIRLAHKKETSVGFQEVIKNHGSMIRTRLGINDDNHFGLILLHTEGSNEELKAMTSELEKVEGLTMTHMETPCMMCETE